MPDTLHALLDRDAQPCCPILEVSGQSYHWSLRQVEYSTDLVFRSDTILKSLDEECSRQAIFSVKAGQVANFLGKKITPQLAQELGSRFTTRIEGSCIKHPRKVEHREGHDSREIAPSERPSTASSIYARSCSGVIAAISNISPHWTTFPPAIATCID